MSNSKRNFKKKKMETEYAWYIEQINDTSKLFELWTGTGTPQFTTTQTAARDYGDDEQAAIDESAVISDFVGTRPVRKPK